MTNTIKTICLVIIILTTATIPALATQSNTDFLTAQISKASTDSEKASLLMSRARLHSNNKDFNLAIADTFEVIKIKNKGHVWLELGYFYYFNKEYKKAFFVAEKIKKEFPTHKREGKKLADKAKKKYLLAQQKHDKKMLAYTQVHKSTPEKEKKLDFCAPTVGYRIGSRWNRMYRGTSYNTASRQNVNGNRKVSTTDTTSIYANIEQEKKKLWQLYQKYNAVCKRNFKGTPRRLCEKRENKKYNIKLNKLLKNPESYFAQKNIKGKVNRPYMVDDGDSDNNPDNTWDDETNSPHVINSVSGYDDQGNHYTPAGGGNAWKSDGTFMQEAAGGYIDTKTGRHIPSN